MPHSLLGSGHPLSFCSLNFLSFVLPLSLHLLFFLLHPMLLTSQAWLLLLVQVSTQVSLLWTGHLWPRFQQFPASSPGSPFITFFSSQKWSETEMISLMVNVIFVGLTPVWTSWGHWHFVICLCFSVLGRLDSVQRAHKTICWLFHHLEPSFLICKPKVLRQVTSDPALPS